MSAIGSFQIVPADCLDKLEAASSGAELFAGIGRFQTASMDFDYDAYVLGTLLPILVDNYGVDLMGEHQDLAEALSQHSGGTIFLLTYEARQLSGKLEPALFDPTELQAEYEDFNGLGFDGVGEIMLEGVKFLRSGIEQLASGTIGILSIS